MGGHTDYTLAQDVNTALISMIADGNYAGAKIAQSTIRKYETDCAAHILGVMGALDPEDLENPFYDDYPMNATVGKSGVEAAFEQYLRGKNGRRVISTNSEGKITGQYYSTEPQPGQHRGADPRYGAPGDGGSPFVPDRSADEQGTARRTGAPPPWCSW